MRVLEYKITLCERGTLIAIYHSQKLYTFILQLLVFFYKDNMPGCQITYLNKTSYNTLVIRFVLLRLSARLSDYLNKTS